MSARLPIETVSEFMKSAPVDVYRLADALGISVRETIAPDDFSGKIDRDPLGRFRITVNATHPKVRKRFTIAHEIAHFILHRDLIGQGISDNGLYRSGLPEQTELQANRYAAEILMPWKLVIEKYRQEVRTEAAMAQTFEVSNAVAGIRIRELAPYFGGVPHPDQGRLF